MSSHYEISLFYDLPNVSKEILRMVIKKINQNGWSINKNKTYLENKPVNEQHPLIEKEDELIEVLSENSGYVHISESFGSNFIEYIMSIEHKKDLAQENDWGPLTRYSYISIIFDSTTIEETGKHRYIEFLHDIAMTTHCHVGILYRDDLFDEMWEFLEGKSNILKPNGVAFYFGQVLITNQQIKLNLENTPNYQIERNLNHVFGYLKIAWEHIGK